MRLNRFRIALNPYVFLSLLLLSPIAESAIINWNITADIYEVDSILSSQFSIGDEINATFTFDTLTPDSEPAVTYRGKYDDAATMSISSYGYFASADNMYITLINEFPADGSDRFLTSTTATSNFIGNSINSYSFAGFNLFLQDDNGGMFSSISLPDNSPNTSLVDDEFFFLTFRQLIAPNTFHAVSVRANNIQISSTPVPAPPTNILFFTGLLGFAFFRKIASKQKTNITSKLCRQQKNAGWDCFAALRSPIFGR